MMMPDKDVFEVNGCVADKYVAFCVLSFGLSSLSNQERKGKMFGRSKSWFSAIFTAVLNHVHDFFATKLQNFLNSSYVSTNLTIFSELVKARIDEHHRGFDEAPMVWGFIDGTFLPINRPGRKHNGPFQKLFWNGYKKSHGLQFQAIVGPTGLCLHLFGPIPGKYPDHSMYNHSGFFD